MEEGLLTTFDPPNCESCKERFDDNCKFDLLYQLLTFSSTYGTIVARPLLLCWSKKILIFQDQQDKYTMNPRCKNHFRISIKFSKPSIQISSGTPLNGIFLFRHLKGGNKPPRISGTKKSMIWNFTRCWYP